MSRGSETMGVPEAGPGENTPSEIARPQVADSAVPHCAPCCDMTGRILPITPEQQARDARAIAAFVERMRSMPDEDPPGAWEEAMHDLDAQRPHRKLFEGLY